MDDPAYSFVYDRAEAARVFQDIGTQGLWERVSRFWDVRLNTRIDQIKRDDKVRIWMNGEEEPEVFDKLILAAPFDESMAYIDHHDHAKELFGKNKQ